LSADPTESETVVERTVTIRNKRGLHARAAAKLVTVAERYAAEVELRGEATGSEPGISARSIMGLMMLGAGIGTVLTVSGRGVDATAAVDAIAELVESGFAEQD